MLSDTTIIKRYNKWPEWVRWILFLPISFVFSVALWFFILWFFLTPADGSLDIFSFGFVIDILHPVVVQVLFLALVFFTVPRGKLIWIKTLIILRALILVFFIAQPILNFMGADLPYDIEFFKDFAGEIFTLAASIWLFKELKEEAAKNKTQQTQKI
jgi:uncharacterized membrane protein